MFAFVCLMICLICVCVLPLVSLFVVVVRCSFPLFDGVFELCFRRLVCVLLLMMLLLLLWFDVRFGLFDELFGLRVLSFGLF